MQLIAGGNLALSQSEVLIKIKTIVPANLSLDITAYLLSATTSKVRGDADMIFYGQKTTPNRSVELIESISKSPFETVLKINTQQIDAAIGKIALCGTIDGSANISALSNIELELWENGQCRATALINSVEKTEKALILAEIYNHKGIWKFRFVNQGFNGGLQPLAEHFGVEIAASASSSPPPVSLSPSASSQPSTPPPASKINLSKITLDKARPSINLSKQDGRFGRISVNLNWNRGAAATPAKGLFNPFKRQASGIDLDLGAMIKFKNGRIDLVQALGERFGQYNGLPYIHLLGDDRTGTSSEGEWLYINGDEWSQIETIVIYTFIYSGVPNWSSTDAFVTIQIPQQAPIEVQLSESSALGTCAIVTLKNSNNTIQAQREVRYFKDQTVLDDYYGFGFKWTTGSK